MATQYNLTLQKGTIETSAGIRGTIFTGSSPVVSWSPVNPDSVKWAKGDSLLIHCGMALNPKENDSNYNDDYNPPASEYVGLTVGACADGNKNEIETLTDKARSLPLGNVGTIVNVNNKKPTIIPGPLKESDDPGSVLFYDATSTMFTFTIAPPIKPGAGNKLKDYIYQWEMQFNHENTLGANGVALTLLDIVFGYGDPHVGDVGMPVKHTKK